MLFTARHFATVINLDSKAIVKLSTGNFCFVCSDQRLPYGGHGGIRSLWGDCILVLPSTELPLSYSHGWNFFHRLLNEAIDTFSEVEYRYILLSVAVSGFLMEGMARYDHYEEIVSSPCSPLSFHCRANMVDIIHRHLPMKLSTLIVKLSTAVLRVSSVYSLIQLLPYIAVWVDTIAMGEIVSCTIRSCYCLI